MFCKSPRFSGWNSLVAIWYIQLHQTYLTGFLSRNNNASLSCTEINVPLSSEDWFCVNYFSGSWKLMWTPGTVDLYFKVLVFGDTVAVDLSPSEILPPQPITWLLISWREDLEFFWESSFPDLYYRCMWNKSIRVSQLNHHAGINYFAGQWHAWVRGVSDFSAQMACPLILWVMCTHSFGLTLVFIFLLVTLGVDLQVAYNNGFMCCPFCYFPYIPWTVKVQKKFSHVSLELILLFGHDLTVSHELAINCFWVLISNSISFPMIVELS